MAVALRPTPAFCISALDGVGGEGDMSRRRRNEEASTGNPVAPSTSYYKPTEVRSQSKDLGWCKHTRMKETCRRRRKQEQGRRRITQSMDYRARDPEMGGCTHSRVSALQLGVYSLCR